MTQITNSEQQTCLKILHLCKGGFGHTDLTSEQIERIEVAFALETPLSGAEVALLCRKLHFVSDWARRQKRRELQAELNLLAEHLRQPTLAAWSWATQPAPVPA